MKSTIRDNQIILKFIRANKHKFIKFFAVAEGLTCRLVSSYKELEAHLEEGTRSRTIAATNMNEISSRAHTIVRLHFTKKSSNGTQKSSEINLVDLSGRLKINTLGLTQWKFQMLFSERQKDSGTEGIRFKEGAMVNQVYSILLTLSFGYFCRCVKCNLNIIIIRLLTLPTNWIWVSFDIGPSNQGTVR